MYSIKFPLQTTHKQIKAKVKHNITIGINLYMMNIYQYPSDHWPEAALMCYTELSVI